MKPWIRPAALGLCAVLISACAGLPSPRGSGPAAEKPVLPEDYARALVLLEREQWVAAEQALLNYAGAHPGMSSPQVNLALVYKRTGRHDEARAALQKALTINPKQAAAHNQLGIYAREAGDFKAARQAYETAIRSNPNYANAHLNLAILLDLYLHQPGAALTHYRHYAELIGEDAMDQTVKSWIADAERQAKEG